ncbi:MAG: hypothetical protein K2X37_05410 [Chitinophagaceae bacterium]|jgi:hypothetical protein|nr:hypothetical protein [Chitinophagaceae bacterium]
MKVLPDSPKLSPEEEAARIRLLTDRLTKASAIILAFVSVFYFFIKLLFL